MEGFPGLEKGRRSLGDEESNAVTDAAFSFVRHFFRPRSLDDLYTLSLPTSRILSSCACPELFVSFFLCLEFTQWPSGKNLADNCVVPRPRPPSEISVSLSRGDTSVTHRRRGGSHSPIVGTLAHNRTCGNQRRGGRAFNGPSPARRGRPTDTSRRQSLAKSEIRHPRCSRLGSC